MSEHTCAKHPTPRHVCYRICRCRCRGCCHVTSEYERHRNRQIAYGRWRPYADAERAREHVRWLQSQGMGWKRVAELAGLPTSTVWKLLYGRDGRPSRRIRPETGARIMRVRPRLEDMAPGARVDAADTHARIRALRDAGWTWSALGDAVGVEGSNLCGVLNRERVSARVALAVRDVWESQRVDQEDAA